MAGGDKSRDKAARKKDQTKSKAAQEREKSDDRARREKVDAELEEWKAREIFDRNFDA
ncbi:hypothetical protein ACFY1P_27595 [Streptomyces sp. NPDC001407]|uniref:hypothetical protein n=1 Tax=unclassified Streptomyces TaxID=2593676 RepID=UPI0033E40BC4